MLALQGEGLELDLQRRRHPMWEWLFSHPMPPGAIFLAEMLAPLASNPVYWTAPLFVGILYGFVHGWSLGILAAFCMGIPLAVAGGCVGKALEIAVVLRFPPRSRGAMIGLMSWLGYASFFLFFLGPVAIPSIVGVISRFFGFLLLMPWPWLRWFLGGETDGSFSFLLGLFNCSMLAAVAITGSVWFSVWGAQQGLAGNFGRESVNASSARKRGVRFGKEPLYKKELLWFIRDRSALVQAVLMPLTMASFQVFNLRHLLSHAQGAWNYLCGTAILFGTYFLWILGPKSLASDGTALWIALTWPRGLESLLKAKAWLWSLLSTGIVALILGYAAFLFPADLWKILLLGVGWFFFARSMAEKSVTLVTVTSSSGEQEKVPRSRNWAVSLGMLTFSIGVFTQQWHVAIMGIVYSYITAAAMWQNFRARLPYLYDPWAEELPAPPTLMHAMISISILVESGAVVTGLLIFIAGSENLALMQAMGYALCAVVVSVGVMRFLDKRGVTLKDVWCWRAPGVQRAPLALSLLAGAVGGVVLAFSARGYLALLMQFRATAELIRSSPQESDNLPDLRLSYVVMGVFFAPWAEEYLFRGLMFRALDREWGGWRAVVGAAAFFAVYHAPLSWAPVFLVGATNALLFKKKRLSSASGRFARGL